VVRAAQVEQERAPVLDRGDLLLERELAKVHLGDAPSEDDRVRADVHLAAEERTGLLELLDVALGARRGEVQGDEAVEDVDELVEPGRGRLRRVVRASQERVGGELRAGGRGEVRSRALDEHAESFKQRMSDSRGRSRATC